MLGVEFVVAIRRHDAKKFTTIGADKTNPVGRLERLPGTPLVPYGGGYLVRYPLVDAESHNAVDGKAAPHGRYLSVWDRVVHQTPKCTWEGTDGGLVRRRCEMRIMQY